MTAGALVMGNAVILKPAGATPVIAHKLVDLLHGAGVPDDALICLPGEGSTVGGALVSSPDIDMVAFTGSRSVGLGIYTTASKVKLNKGGAKKLILEMSGKNAIAVLADADIDEAIRDTLHSAFGHANQKCSACSRVFVQRSIYKRFVQRLKEAATSMTVGPADQPGTRINPLINEAARQRVLSLAETAQKDGKILLDCLSVTQPKDSCNLGPMLVEVGYEKSFTSSITQEEIFGPILPIVPFDSEPDLIKAINSTTYAMTAGVFSRSPVTMRRLVRGIQAGNIYLNREITGARVGIEPFGGFRLSGTGPKAGSEEYIFAFARRNVASETKYTRTGEQPSIRQNLDIFEWHVNGKSRVNILSMCLAKIESEKSFTAGKNSQSFDIVRKVLSQSTEILEKQPTIDIPGQVTFNDWATPRGTGVIAISESTPPENVLSFTFGALLAGNGVVVFPSENNRGLCKSIVAKLKECGVSSRSLKIAPDGVRLGDLLSGTITFAILDLPRDRVLEAYSTLGNFDPDQISIKALFTPDDMFLPGEEGFLRQFALAKTIAVRTLRRGADLALGL